MFKLVVEYVIIITMQWIAIAARGDYGLLRGQHSRQHAAAGGYTETIEQHLQHLAEGNLNCQYNRMHRRQEMTKNYIRNKTVTCNDGTPSG